MDLRSRLRDEFARRVSRNRRYSMRAFARSLSVHHVTLGRVLSGERGFSRSLLRRLASRIRLTPGEVEAALAYEDARKVLHAATSPGFRADSRWIATRTGIDVDDVNRALHLLIHQRRLILSSTSSWTIVDQ